MHTKTLEVTQENQIQEIVDWAQTMFGKMDLIINNAGINPKDYADKSKTAKTFNLKDLDAQELLDVIHINSIAPLLMVKHFKPLLLLSEKPVVINISSWLGSVIELSFGGHSGYVGIKNRIQWEIFEFRR